MKIELSARFLHAFLLVCVVPIAIKAKAEEPIRWVTVSGTAAVAQKNTGYLLTGNSKAMVSLPASPAVGAVVRLAGVGGGQWSAVAGNGQSIQINVSGNFGLLGSSGNIMSIASSSDGTKLVVGTTGGVYVSTDGGLTWPTNSGQLLLSLGRVFVASSADGSLLLADWTPAGLLESTNWGATWSMGGIDVLGGPVACSADGTKIAQVYGGPEVVSAGPIPEWIEAPGGNSPSAVWSCLASSSSGSSLIAAVGGSTSTLSGSNLITVGRIYTSSDYGATWTANGPVQNWTAVATSADGTKLVAVAAGSQIYTSSDSGSTWTAQGNTANWTSVSSSADGTLLAAAAGGAVYTSVNSGATWTTGGLAGTVVCCSGDGSKLIVGNGNQITVQPFPDASGKLATTFSAVVGTQLSSVELIFVGNGRWQLLSHEGPLSFQ